MPTDVMFACFPGDLAAQDCILGMEFSGRDSQGNKIMGLLPAKVGMHSYSFVTSYSGEMESK